MAGDEALGGEAPPSSVAALGSLDPGEVLGGGGGLPTPVAPTTSSFCLKLAAAHEEGAKMVRITSGVGGACAHHRRSRGGAVITPPRDCRAHRPAAGSRHPNARPCGRLHGARAVKWGGAHPGAAWPAAPAPLARRSACALTRRPPAPPRRFSRATSTSFIRRRSSRSGSTSSTASSRRPTPTSWTSSARGASRCG